MTLDSKKAVISIHLRRVIILLVAAIGAICIMLFGQQPQTFWGLTKYNWAIVVAIIYVITVVIDVLKGYNYVFFNDESDFIVLRYFSLSYANHKKKSIEIPKNDFVSYEIKTAYFGLQQQLILRRKVKGQEANYPPLSISILDKQGVELILGTLDKYQRS